MGKIDPKIYEVKPLTCIKCQGKMRIIAFIEYEEVTKKILKHLNLWDVKPRPPPDTQAAAEKTETIIDDSFSFPPFWQDQVPGHCLAICALPWPRPGLVLSIPRNPLLSIIIESSVQIELDASGQA